MSSLNQKDTLKILWYFFKPYKSQVSVALVLMILASLFESLNLAAIYPIMNYGLKLEAQEGHIKFLDQLVAIFGQQNLFTSACVMLIVITIVATIMRIVYSYYSNKLIAKIIADNQKAIFDKYLNADYRFFVEHQQGKLIYAGTVAPAGVSNNVMYITRVANSLMTCIFFTILLFVLAWQGTLFILGLSLVYVVFVRRITKGIVNRYAHYSVEEDRKKNVILNEFITGIKSIKIFLSLHFWQEKYAQAVERSALYNFKVMMGRVVPDSTLKCIFFLAFGVIGIVLNVKQSGNIVNLIPLLGTFGMVALRLIPYVNLVGNDIVAIARFMPDTKIVYDTLNTNMNELSVGTKMLPDFKNEIRFNQVWFKHKGVEESLLKGISFSIPKRKMTAIVGPSGSGKSTIVNLLLRLYETQKGAITIDGIDIRELKIDSYLDKIGYVSQETFIFNGTIADNIRFGLQKASDNDIIQAAKLANAHDFILAAEHGYDAIVGDAGVKLSGGQRQRIAIARAMLRKPQIMVLDEATSSLDNISERVVQEAIENISHHTTVLVIAHRLTTVQKADQIIVLDHGQVMEQGTHEDLLEKQQAYFSLYKNDK